MIGGWVAGLGKCLPPFLGVAGFLGGWAETLGMGVTVSIGLGLGGLDGDKTFLEPEGDFDGEPVDVNIGEKPVIAWLSPWSSLGLVTTTGTPSTSMIPDSHGDVIAGTGSGRVASKDVKGLVVPDGPAGMSMGFVRAGAAEEVVGGRGAGAAAWTEVVVAAT